MHRCLFSLSLFPCLAILALSSAQGVYAHPGIHEQEQQAKTALRDSPEDPKRHISMGRVHVEKQEWDAALAAYSEARRFGAEQEKILILEGVAYLGAGWPQMSRDRFERILRSQPEHAAAHLGRARAWMKLDHPARAAKDYEFVVAKIEPLRPGHVLEYRDALQAIDRGGDALAALDIGLERLGQVPSLQLAAIDLNLEAKQYDEALRRLDGLLATSPRHPLWATQRAEILEQAGRKEEARLAYTKALAQLQSRNANGRARRLSQIEDRVRAALARPNPPEEATP